MSKMTFLFSTMLLFTYNRATAMQENKQEIKNESKTTIAPLQEEYDPISCLTYDATNNLIFYVPNNCGPKVLKQWNPTNGKWSSFLANIDHIPSDIAINGQKIVFFDYTYKHICVYNKISTLFVRIPTGIINNNSEDQFKTLYITYGQQPQFFFPTKRGKLWQFDLDSLSLASIILSEKMPTYLKDCLGIACSSDKKKLAISYRYKNKADSHASQSCIKLFNKVAGYRCKQKFSGLNTETISIWKPYNTLTIPCSDVGIIFKLNFSPNDHMLAACDAKRFYIFDCISETYIKSKNIYSLIYDEEDYQKVEDTIIQSLNWISNSQIILLIYVGYKGSYWHNQVVLYDIDSGKVTNLHRNIPRTNSGGGWCD